MSLIVEDIFLVGSSLFHQGCSADSCDFGVPMRGGELRTSSVQTALPAGHL